MVSFKILLLKKHVKGYYVFCLEPGPKALGFCQQMNMQLSILWMKKHVLHMLDGKNVDGVLTAATDYGVLTMSYIAQELELPGINYEAAKRIRNKAAVRKCLF